MTQSYTLLDFSSQEPAHVAAVTTVWNAACSSELMLSNRFVEFNLQPVTGGKQAGQIARQGETIVGFVLASTLPGQPHVAPATVGWIDAIAVTPQAQRQGIGSALLAWAEAWLTQQTCQTFVLGASQHPFVPGVPSTLETAPFFQRRGYGQPRSAWDVAADLNDYKPPATVREIQGEVRPAQPGDAEALSTFLQREFSGRWHFEFEEFLRHPDHRLSDYMILWSERGVDGFCQLTFEDSLRPMERFFPYQLPRHWGQLGPIGVSADRRGLGYGAALLDAGIRRLYNSGVNGCVIDWTTHLALYGKFGFTPYREYIQLNKKV
ncbi:MAG: GNAT family N-acetyltransferase [Caldilineaceae bacterium]|nr:GNAT family N-acetyltransferase [Caldilineaceae bacterium]